MERRKETGKGHLHVGSSGYLKKMVESWFYQLRFAKDQTQLVGEWQEGKITSGKHLGQNEGCVAASISQIYF